MADVATIGGAGAIAAVVTLAPKAFSLVQTWIARRSDVAIEAIKAETREETASHKARANELGVAERMILDRAGDHKACREEVAVLRHEVGELRVSIVACETKHDAAQSMIDWLKDQVERLNRRSNPPEGEPAE